MKGLNPVHWRRQAGLFRGSVDGGVHADHVAGLSGYAASPGYAPTPRPGVRQPNPLGVLIHWVKNHLRSWLQILPSLRRRRQCCVLRVGASPA
jgi:hypothetical protein